MADGDFCKNCTCGRSFKSRSGLTKHRRKNKCCNVIPLPTNSCKEDNCNFTYRLNQDLRTHLMNVHNFNIESETVLFNCYEDFLVWKEKYEAETKSYFVKHSKKKTKKTLGSSTQYFSCHRSGKYRSKSKGKRKEKKQGSAKINSTCTAALKVTVIPNSFVKVDVCHTHYGHKMDLIHLKVSKRDRELIAGQMNQGISKENILHTLSPSNAVTLQRKHLLRRKDLFNICKSFGVKKSNEKVKQYRLSVDDFFHDMIHGGTASVLLYKKRKEEVLTFPENEQCPFEAQDFAFAFMYQFQQEIFLAYGNGVICFDSTSDCNRDQTVQPELSPDEAPNIFSVVVLDDFGDGIPVAWLISNRDDGTILRFFFQQIKRLIGSVTPKAILSDRSSNCYSTWVDVFGGEPRKLLCSWHVSNEWQKTLSRLEDQDAAIDCYKVLRPLLEEHDLGKFVILIQRCIKEMNNKESLTFFARYFCDEWAVIQEQWATCFRSIFSFDTNFHVESIHETFKELFLQEKFRKSPNKCLNLVINYCSDLNKKRHEKHEQEKNKLLQSHRLVLARSLDSVKQVSPKIWYVTTDENSYGSIDDSSGNTYNLVYIVEELRSTCTRVCNVRCTYCEVCMHLFKCSCSESKSVTEVCEHIHLVARAKMVKNICEIKEVRTLLSENPIIPDIASPDHNYIKVVTKESLPISSFGGKNKPILPKPTGNLTTGTNLLTFIVLPDSSQESEPSIEGLKSTLLKDLDTITSKIQACTDRSALLCFQKHIESAKTSLEMPHNTVIPFST